MRPRLGMLLFLTLLVSVGARAQNNPLVGTWKVNVTKIEIQPRSSAEEWNNEI